MRPGLPVQLVAETLSVPFASRRSNMPLKEHLMVRNHSIIIGNLYILKYKSVGAEL